MNVVLQKWIAKLFGVCPKDVPPPHRGYDDSDLELPPDPEDPGNGDLILVLQAEKEGGLKLGLEGRGAAGRQPSEVLPENFLAFLNESGGKVVNFMQAMSNVGAGRSPRRM